MTRKQFIAAVLVLAAVAGVAYFIWQRKPEAQVQKPRTPVQIVKSVLAQQKSIPVTIQANGYVSALNTVDVRPQIQNIVRSVHVREGQEVKAGQLLFTLDARSDLAGVENAQAQMAKNRADLVEAEAALKRNQELLARNFVSQAVVDTAASRVAALRSTVRGDQAAIQSSSVALSHNKISASIGGRLGAISVRPGSLAQPGGDPMVSIVQLDPIAVSFSLAERELQHIRASYPDGAAPVRAQLAGGQEVGGTLYFIDNAADAQTGTIRMKAQFPNQDRRMWPGTYVSVRLVARTLPDAVVVPAQAIVTGPVDKFVYVVQPDDTVKPQNVEVLTIAQGEAAVAGLNAGARVVVEGTQNLRPGSKIQEAGAKKGQGASGAARVQKDAA
ncbi:efflux RND transporter periplasmic adaptor subunit [Noviherbaspirillum sedimenti]|uniref:efflux RND transporter periplasmic adaptor subunit n=1 Tax=Noviherbaspirillum sedimenti TaxID=2320865 RepID=UPI001F3BA380|nr:efflux RND transporter periplasmic adaptor subunit [Noviherbaspirillum sedimenti]